MIKSILTAIVTLTLISCSSNYNKEVYINNENDFNRAKNIIINNVNYKTDYTLNDKIIPKKYFIRSEKFRKDSTFNSYTKDKLLPNDFLFIIDFCDRNNIKEILVGGNDLVLFQIKVDNGFPNIRWYNLVYCENETLLNNLNYNFIETKPINKKWYGVIYKTSMAN